MFDSMPVDVESVRRTLVGDPDDSAPEADEFFTPAFMAEHTEFDSFEAFCAAGPDDLDPERPTTVSTDRLDAYVDRVTDFPSWRVMRNQAAEREVVKRLTA